MKSVFKAVATVTIFSIITRALGFVFRVVLSRKLGAEGLGLFQMASSVLGIFVTIISSGLPVTTAKLVSNYETANQLKHRNQVVSSSVLISIILAIVCSAVVFLLKDLWSVILADNRAVCIIIILIPSIIFSAVYSVFRGALWGQNDYFNCGLTELIEQIVRIVLTVIFLMNINDYFVSCKLSAWAFDITCLISALLSAVIYLKKAKFDFKKGYYKSIIKSSAPITGVRLASSLVQPLCSILIPNLLLVYGFSKSEALACFGTIMGMTFPLLFIPMSIVGSISMVLVPSISSLAFKKDYSTIKSNITRAFEVVIFVSMVFVPLFISVGNLMGIVLFNNLYSGVLLQLSAVCVIPICLCNLTGSILNALNLEAKSFKNYLFGSLILFAILLSLTPFIGINAVIIGEFVCMMTISLLNFKKIKSVVPGLEFNLISTISKYSVVILPCSLLGHFVANICVAVFSNLFSAIIGGGIACLSMIILCKILKIFNPKDLLLLKRQKPKTENE